MSQTRMERLERGDEEGFERREERRRGGQEKGKKGNRFFSFLLHLAGRFAPLRQFLAEILLEKKNRYFLFGFL